MREHLNSPPDCDFLKKEMFMSLSTLLHLALNMVEKVTESESALQHVLVHCLLQDNSTV